MIQSIVKVSEILDAFSLQRPVLTLKELAEITGYPKTTLYALVATLVHTGLLEKRGSTYAVGTTIIRLSQAVRVNVEIRDRAAPLLRQIAEDLRESVYLTVPDGDRVLYIYAIESTHRLRARSAIGDRAFFHSTSVGKAMLAFLDSETVDSILTVTGLPAQTPNTITQRSTLDIDLQKIRARGYSLDCGENESNIFCVGAPIFDDQSRVIASCSLSGNSEAIVTTQVEKYSKPILEVAEQISRRMGYVPLRPDTVYVPRPPR